MEYNLVCEDIEGFFPFQNMYVKYAETDQFIKCCL
jgi:hypothetical protein